MRDAAPILSIGAVLLALFLWPISTCVVVLSMIGLLVFQANRPAMRRQVQRHNALPGAQLTQAPYSPTNMVAYPSSPTLHERIIHQVHFYFSAENLCRDEFLRGHMDPREGWVPIQLIASFNRLRSLTKDVNLVVEALRLSPELEVRNGMVRKRHDWQRWLLPQAQLGGPTIPTLLGRIIQRVEERVHLPRRSSRSPVRQQREPPTTHQVLGTTNGVLGGPTSPTPLSSRAFVPVPSLCATGAVPAADARLVSYNILADELCITAKHSYCPVKDREWRGKSGRGARLVAELLSYEADIVCLQECSLRKFNDCFRPRLGQKYTGFHHSEHLTGHAAEQARTDRTGLAIFVRSAAWKPVKVQAVRLGDHSAARGHIGSLKNTLQSLKHSVLMVLLEHVASGARLAVGNTHLFWDPKQPHVKSSQAELAAQRLAAFASEGTPCPVALVGDFNTVPHLQPEHLPSAQQAALPEPLPIEWQDSAIYRLLSNGTVEPTHPEHPTAFTDFTAGEVNRLGPLTTGVPLRDAYWGVLAPGPLPLTTHADDFAGCLDYCWISPAIEVMEVLAMPYELRAHTAFGKIPSAEFPSDHLAIACTLAVPI
jgi:mRNA deadenylase 3'-5' endonuclease subunit Ccr4